MTSHSYFVVMIDYGRRGLEAIVDPEITRREVVSRIASGEYPRDRIAFIHEINEDEGGGTIRNVTEEILEAAALPEPNIVEIDLQALRFDHARDLRKHEVV